MSRLCRFLIILIAACTAAGCAPPIGSIDGQGTADFWVVPKQDKYKYNQYDSFTRNDFEVFTSYRGAVESVPVTDVEIGIAEDPKYPDVMNYLASGKDYRLINSGKKIVVVEYRGMSDRYSIEVLEKEFKPGIIIKWAE